MDDIGNPVVNARWAWLEIHWISPNFCEFWLEFHQKPFKVLQNSGTPRDCESAGFGILQKLLLSFLQILKFLGTQFSVVHRGCVGILLNSPPLYYFELLLTPH